ncbi:ComEC/Rec2 family competence protein [Candidatus Saccharibacteria bacterium]|nr:ComEC/Rec2 family competence protein [Candidatus Saccharibacteria bacterium]
MRRSWQITTIVIGFLVGIVIAANFAIAITLWWLVPLLLACAGLLFVRGKLGYVLFCVLGLIIGLCRFGIYIYNNPIRPLQALYSQKIDVVGVVVGEPTRDDNRDYVFYINNLKINGRSVGSMIKVKALSGAAREGNTVLVTGKLYPIDGSNAEASIGYAKVKIISSSQSFLVQVKQRFLAGLRAALDEPASSFMAGILLGSRSGLPRNLQDLLAAVGLSHIVAISGYNLTILTGFLQRHFGRNWRWGGLVFSLWAILGFVLLTGASPSIVRAGIMSALFLVMSYYGRKLNIFTALSLAAAAMLLLNPSLLITDIGWQLSFLSLTGIVLLAPKFQYILPKRPSWLNELLAVSLAAQLATAGLIVYIFGQVSLVAPLANLIVLPLVPVLMLIGTVLALFGMALPELAYFLGHSVTWLVNQLFDLISYLSRLPLAANRINGISLLAVAAYYAILLAWVFLVRPSQAKGLSTDLKNAIIGVNSVSSQEHLKSRAS